MNAIRVEIIDILLRDPRVMFGMSQNTFNSFQFHF